MKKTSSAKVLFLALTALTNGGCSLQTYQDYPWGNYPWESNHNHRFNSGEAWDDFEQYFGKDQPKPSGG